MIVLSIIAVVVPSTSLVSSHSGGAGALTALLALAALALLTSLQFRSRGPRVPPTRRPLTPDRCGLSLASPAPSTRYCPRCGYTLFPRLPDGARDTVPPLQ